VHDILAQELLRELHSQAEWRREVVRLLKSIDKHLNPHRVLGGVMTQIGDPMLPIQPGNTVKFQVTPAFSGAPFTLDGTKAAITTDDANAVATIDAADPQGTTFDIALADVPLTGSLSIAVDWAYTNLDGTVAHVTGTLTENGIVDDVTGGTFLQIA
jgi:hypothetical protein